MKLVEETFLNTLNLKNYGYNFMKVSLESIDYNVKENCHTNLLHFNFYSICEVEIALSDF